MSKSAPEQAKRKFKGKKHGLQKYEIPPEKLRWSCPTEKLNFKTTDQIEPLTHIVGQPRAIEAIRLGAGLMSKGYNIFVSGLSGTGRLTTVKAILEEVTTVCPLTYDFCYVNNFSDPDTPRLIKLPRGKGKEFATNMGDVIQYLRRSLPRLFEEDSFQESRRRIIEEFQAKERDILNQFDEKIKPHGFVRGQLENEQGAVMPEVFPLIKNKPVRIDQIPEYVEKGTITKEKAEEINADFNKFHTELYELARIGMKLMQDFKKAMADNDKSASTLEVTASFNTIKERYKNEKVDIYIEEVIKYILDNITLFVPQTNPQNPPSQEGELTDADKFHIFTVNVILDNSNTTSAPVVIETKPSYTNLFGTIERTYDPRGFWRTDFAKIKAGALLKADQGYLIVNALDLFGETGVWPALKRVLLYDKLEIQPFDAYFQLSQVHLKPEPIDVNVKVIIIGGQTLYQLLYLYEKGFKKIFKINAQFDYETARTDELITNISRFVAKTCRDEQLPHCTSCGVAALVEWAAEHAGSQQRLSLKFSDVADILREAAFYHRNSHKSYIEREDVENAIKERRFRNNLLDEKLRTYILENSIFIDTQGERIGQINGLTILNNGILSFGKPARITAVVSAGSGGIVNIEREVDMSGSIHSKGLLIISGFLRSLFAQKKSLSFTASIAFEQSYSGIDGDSASAAEIYVLLSALSEIPIKQNLAVTGSVNQKGDIQPIGGVNEKIRGFYEICFERGLTGDQGVIIPEQNAKDLMLTHEIIDAVKEGKFHIYTIKRIEEGVELLMGKPAGKMLANGTFTKNSVYDLADKRLIQLKKAGKSAEEKDNKKKPIKKKPVQKTPPEE